MTGAGVAPGAGPAAQTLRARAVTTAPAGRGRGSAFVPPERREGRGRTLLPCPGHAGLGRGLQPQPR